MPRIVTQQDIQSTLRTLGLADVPVCIHAAFRSFGTVAGGPVSLIAAFLEAQCTLLVPTFSWSFAVPPPPDQLISPERLALLTQRTTMSPSSGILRHEAP